MLEISFKFQEAFNIHSIEIFCCMDAWMCLIFKVPEYSMYHMQKLHIIYYCNMHKKNACTMDK